MPPLLLVVLPGLRQHADKLNTKAWARGLGSARVILSGNYGELAVTGGVPPRRICWSFFRTFCLYIVCELVAGLYVATNSEEE